MRSGHLIIEYRASATSFVREVLAAGSVRRIGRTSLADIVVPFDDSISQIHWEVSWDGRRCEVRDIGSASGTFLGGRPVDTEEAKSGAWVRTGRTDFSLFFEDVEETPGRTIPPVIAAAHDKGDLFALLDSARDERILPMLQRAIDPYDSLFDGTTRDTMADCAPYIVRFAKSSSLLPRLIDAGWCDAWGIFGETGAKLSELRDHFRRLLIVTSEADGLPMYFRFYDPRVLRVFLPITTLRQRESVFGPIRRFMIEAKDQKEMVFDHDGKCR